MIILVIALACSLIRDGAVVSKVLAQHQVSPVLDGVVPQEFSRPQTYQTILSSTATGSVRIIVVLVEFSDVKHVATKDAVSHLIFEQMADYYRQVSYGALNVVGNVTQWITLNRAMSYYGEDTGGSIDPDSSRLVVDAVAAIESTIDLSQYQNVMVMHAGAGQESEPGKTSYIWSVYYDDLTILTKAGSRITAAEIVPESESTNGLTTCLGVAAHEFAHSLGLPDLYDEKSLDDRDYVGPWSLMSKGTWLGNPKGSAPSELEAYSRNFGAFPSCLARLLIQEVVQVTRSSNSPSRN
jgi:M6 family metalloprotease-like protein